MLLPSLTTFVSEMMRNRKNFLLAWFLLSSLLLSAQTTKVSDLNQADNLLLDSKYNEAIAWLDQQIRKTKDPKTAATLKTKKAEAYIRLGDLEGANKLLTDLEQEIKGITNSSFLEALIKTNE